MSNKNKQVHYNHRIPITTLAIYKKEAFGEGVASLVS